MCNNTGFDPGRDQWRLEDEEDDTFNAFSSAFLIERFRYEETTTRCEPHAVIISMEGPPETSLWLYSNHLPSFSGYHKRSLIGRVDSSVRSKGKRSTKEEKKKRRALRIFGRQKPSKLLCNTYCLPFKINVNRDTFTWSHLQVFLASDHYPERIHSIDCCCGSATALKNCQIFDGYHLLY